MRNLKKILAGLILCSCLLASLPVYAAEPDQSDHEYVNAGPGVVQAEGEDTTSGMCLGTFTITGYCNCESCSGGHNLTYSGTVPKANHTISADLNLFPIGTKLLIDGVVYTVEDMGSSVNGNKIDIYYATHEEALAAGTYSAQVFRWD